MSQPPSGNPSAHPGEEPVAQSVPKLSRARSESFPFHLSAKQFAKVTREMLGVARRVCSHSGGSPWDVVQEAWITALSKPSRQRPSIHDEKNFSGWMCELARYESLTTRNDELRHQHAVALMAKMAELVDVPHFTGAVEARKMLKQPFMGLEPEELELLRAVYAEGKTIDDLATEQEKPWSTMDYRHRRLLALLRAAIQALVVAAMLVPKKARAFVAHIARQSPRMLLQATQFGGAVTAAVVCGVLLPAGSSVTTEPSILAGLTPYSTPQTTMAQATSLRPSFIPEVEPEEPKALDAETNQCSAVEMKSTKFARVLHETAAPLAILTAATVAQVACTGTECQTPPVRQPEDEADAEYDEWNARENYKTMCLNEQLRGNKCMSREEWDKIGRHR